MNYSESAIHAWMGGWNASSFLLLGSLARAAGTTPDDLLGFCENPPEIRAVLNGDFVIGAIEAILLREQWSAHEAKAFALVVAKAADQANLLPIQDAKQAGMALADLLASRLKYQESR